MDISSLPDICNGVECGSVDDDCGISRVCGSLCLSPKECNALACEAPACVDKRTDVEVCRDDNYECGEIGDICGEIRVCPDGCSSAESCVAGVCVTGPAYEEWTCTGTATTLLYGPNCVWWDDDCAPYDGGGSTGDKCGWFWMQDIVECWNFTEATGECSTAPTCPVGFPDFVSNAS